MYSLWHVFLFRNKRKQKHRVPDSCYVNNNYGNIIKFMKVRSNLHNAKRGEIQKISFPRKLVENPGLYKPVLNKIMTTHE